MVNLNLNDSVNTSLTDLQVDGANRQISLAQLLYQGRGVYISDDFGPGHYGLPVTYTEDATHFLGQFLAQLSQAGEQQLTFDNLTYSLVKYQALASRSLLRRYPPYAWNVVLDFTGKDGWWQDAAATTMAPLTLTVDAGQAFNITYAGSVWAEPVWTYVHPNTDTRVINSLVLSNTMAGEALTVNFLSVAPLPASTARTVTIDSLAQRVTDSAGNEYDVSGTFPKLYPPASQVNACSIAVTTASGATAGCTIGETHYARWQI